VSDADLSAAGLDSKPEDFWPFSLRVYDLEGVREACLRLQDRDGAEVNLLLFGAWAATRRSALPESIIEQALAVTRKWSDAIIRPLRETRRDMKANAPADASDAVFATLRRSVQAAELAGERQLQSALEALVPEFRTGSPRAITIAAGNVLCLFRSAGLKLEEDLLADVRTILLTAFDERPPVLNELVAAPQVVTVDGSGEKIGLTGRLGAHLPPAQRHEAVSVLLRSEPGRWLLQRRVDTKCAFGGYWANSCCTHPFPGEAPVDTARRRSLEELGIEIESVEAAGAFAYDATDPETGFIESEYDHVFVAHVAGEPTPTVDPAEIAQTAWLTPEEALGRIGAPDTAPWFGPVAELAKEALLSHR